MIYNWVGEVLLNTKSPSIVSEIGFLERLPDDTEVERTGVGREDVGRIDNVLVNASGSAFNWCALEIQAVYFSGEKMSHEFKLISEMQADGIPFPERVRRPDFRSSGPKRLMPQLQTKVPALRRWGKKMAVVVDEAFFQSLGRMETVGHVSNCDIAWFVVGYDESAGQAMLVPRDVVLTTLERAVEGLTGGQPISLDVFEDRIRGKMDTAINPATNLDFD